MLVQRVAGSVGAGVLLGSAMAAYLRFVGRELLVFFVGAIFLASYATAELSLEPIPLFLSAGLMLGNLSQRGDDLMRAMGRLSLPVYLVFFTFVGATFPVADVVTLFPWRWRS
jgi:hypothetical protein